MIADRLPRRGRPFCALGVDGFSGRGRNSQGLVLDQGQPKRVFYSKIGDCSVSETMGLISDQR